MSGKWATADQEHRCWHNETLELTIVEGERYWLDGEMHICAACVRANEPRTLTATEIDQLNERARIIRAAQNDPDDSAGVGIAIEQAAAAAGLTEIKADDACTIYKTADGRLVNCWGYGPQSYEIQDGGAGFDDQIEWADEEACGD